MIDFRMPSLGADMESGLLAAWHKQPGDHVHRGELIAEVETDKGIIEIEAFDDGVVDEILVHEGTRIPVGTVMARIRQPHELTAPTAQPAQPADVSVSNSAAAPQPATSGNAQAAPTQTGPVTQTASPALRASPPAAVDPRQHTRSLASRLPISPSARRLARELDVDPTTVSGTGHGGAITRDDIERAAAAAKTAAEQVPPAMPLTAAPTAGQDMTTRAATAKTAVGPADRSAAERMRQVIAAAMTRSKREIPHYYLSTTIDMQPAMNWLAEQNRSRPITERLLYGVLLIKAVALALKEVRELNSVWESEKAVQKPSIHVGVAISLRGGGLIAPAIHDTDQKNLNQLMREFQDLVNRARRGGLRSSELSDPTITVTSLGEKGVETVFGVIYPPQTAIVGFGKVVERPWSIQGGLMSRQVVTATLSADHRVSDGHRGGLFLSAVERLLQEPEKL